MDSSWEYKCHEDGGAFTIEEDRDRLERSLVRYIENVISGLYGEKGKE